MAKILLTLRTTLSAFRLRARDRLQARPDREHETALNRLAFFGLIAAYLSLTPQPEPALADIVCVAYGLFGILIIAAVQLHSVVSHGRRIIALIADLAALSMELHLNGQVNAVFYPLYLWIIFGNGFRFGLAYLFLAMSIALIGFGLVLESTAYWRQQPLLSAGLLLGLLILPAYSGSLIRKLSEAKRVAEEANRSKSRFLANVSHELRTPLNAILGSASLLRGTALGPEQRELTDALSIGTRALLSLIGGILDFSRIEANRMPLRLEPLDLPDLLADIRELLSPQARLKMLRLRFHVTPRVASTIVSDRRHLYEVLLNLVSNAIKFTANGQVTVSVDAIEAGPSRQRLRFEVADTGIGIAAEACERIFDSFAQAQPDIIDRFGGTGLGLSIARQLVTLMGGKIAVDSLPGNGSTFWFNIECETGTAAPEDAAIARQIDRSISDVRVVLLFDDALLAERIRRQLDALGLFVERSEDEQDASFRLHNPPQAAARSRSLLLLQRDAVRPDVPLDQAADSFLASIGDYPVIAVTDASGMSDQLPEFSFRRHIGTWIERQPTDAGCCLALRKIAGRPNLQDAEEMPQSAAAAVAAERLHVLVADDNDINLRVVARVLERAGHTMRLVKDGSAALDALEQERFDIVLMDVNMPVMSGIEATKLYRFTATGEPTIPIVALTADATPEMAQACREAGMTTCLTKPVQVFTLAATLEQLARADAQPRSRGRGDTADNRTSGVRPVFDQQILQNLTDLGGREFLDELIESFAVDVEQLVARIGDAAHQEDLAQFRNHTHALRSCAANVGAAAIQDLCSECRDIRRVELRSRGVAMSRLLSDELLRLQRSLTARSHDVSQHTAGAAPNLPISTLYPALVPNSADATR